MLRPSFLLTNKIPLTIYRRSEGTWVEGEWVEGSTTSVEIQANVQPVKPHQLLIFPESERSKKWLRVFSADLLRTLKEGTDGWDADEFEWKGERFKIMKVDDWTEGMGILEHCEALAVRVELTPN